MKSWQRRHEALGEILGVETRIRNVPWERACTWREAPATIEGLYDLHNPDVKALEEHIKMLQEMITLGNQIELEKHRNAGPVVVKINDQYFPLAAEDLKGVQRQKNEGKSTALVLEIYKREKKKE